MIQIRFQSKTLVRLLLVVAFAVMALTGFLGVTAPREARAIAVPGATTYYSNATRTVVVGREIYGCCGQYSFWGQRTKFKTFERLYCLDVPCDQ